MAEQTPTVSDDDVQHIDVLDEEEADYLQWVSDVVMANTTCAICLFNLYSRRPKRYGPCPHVFCLHCIKTYYKNQGKNYPPCPVWTCGRPITLRLRPGIHKPRHHSVDI